MRFPHSETKTLEDFSILLGHLVGKPLLFSTLPDEVDLDAIEPLAEIHDQISGESGDLSVFLKGL